MSNRLSGVSSADSVPPQVSFWMKPYAERTLLSVKVAPASGMKRHSYLVG